MERKFNKLTITQKRKKDYLRVTYNLVEVSKDRQTFDANYIKTSNQPMTRELSDAIKKLIPHLMYGSELVDSTMKLKDNLDYEAFFNKFHFQDDERFDGVEVTGVQFYGKESLDSIKIFGYKETQLTAKPFKVKIETPVINLDRMEENRYALCALLCDHVDDLETLLDNWLTKGDTLPANQVEMELK